jgi:hypothetical protein
MKTQEVAPAWFVIHEAAAVHEAIQGPTQRINPIIGPILYPLLIEGVRVKSDQAKGIINHGVK